MKPKSHIFLFVFMLFAITYNASSQVAGDTIRVQAFNFDSTSRDTLISFPDIPNVDFRKILLKYKMRCKDGLISTGSERDKGCGEWDYSCNTFIADSSRIEEVERTHPNYVISNFSGTQFDYTTQQTYDRFNFSQKLITINNIISETSYPIGSGSETLDNIIKTDNKTGRSFILVKASELTGAGLTAGAIHGLNLSVSNSGESAEFFRLNIKHTNLSELSTATLDFDNFTEVFFNDYNFVNGNNRLQFHTPFTWDGTSNLILDMSFSNVAESSNISFVGSNSADVRTITASNTGSLDFSSDAVIEASSQFFNTVNNEITVMFWAKGNENMPTNNFVVYGKDADSNRQLNIHLPWGNDIYFDCGYEGGYDRINKAFTTEQIKGQWNHWAFTKNATDGTMKIYYNGVLWHSGTDKNNVIDIVDLFIGKQEGSSRVLNAELKELSFWDKELSVSTILDWKNKTIDATHPDYNNLVSYYKFDEGSGQNVTESKHNLTDFGTNLIWKYERGNQLTTIFTESTSYPNITFYRGSYDLSLTTHGEQYLHPKSPNIVSEYTIIDNSGVTPFIHDTVDVVSVDYLFEAVPENVYDGDTGIILTTVPVTIEGTITITDLTYIERYPFYNELVSFVTPYGIYLDLGMEGKAWYFDMTDYVSLLKGDKRLVMNGGVWQEDLDLEFLFVVGTPPSDVIEYNQVWQGSYRIGSAPISQILDDTKFESKDILFDANASAFKLKSSITGHGSEGEFHQNGGLVYHKILFNSIEELNWTITQECSFNPIYPQGGTWVYDRQGWCPGEKTLLKEQDITPFVTPGATISFDYNTSVPNNSNGDYRYLAAHQIVSYGAPNFLLDASVVAINAPNNTALYTRTGTICANPTVTIQNTGANTLTSLTINYWLNDSQSPQTYEWTGSLEFMETEEVNMTSTAELWSDIIAGDNVFNVSVSNPNGGTDAYSYNNTYASNFDIPNVFPQEFILEFKTNNRAYQNSYEILDAANDIVGENDLPLNNTVYPDNYNLDTSCYRLFVIDTAQDGIEWWANPAQGVGYIKVKNNSGTVLYTFEPDFGGGFEYSFTTNFPLTAEEVNFLTSIKLFPNPSVDIINIEAVAIASAEISFANITGQSIHLKRTNLGDNQCAYNTSSLSSGVYIITIKKEGIITTRKFIKE